MKRSRFNEEQIIAILKEGERFEPPVRFHVLSKPPATQNLSQNTDGYAFAR